jgi:hypothetical protein
MQISAAPQELNKGENDIAPEFKFLQTDDRQRLV